MGRPAAGSSDAPPVGFAQDRLTPGVQTADGCALTAVRQSRPQASCVRGWASANELEPSLPSPGSQHACEAAVSVKPSPLPTGAVSTSLMQ